MTQPTGSIAASLTAVFTAVFTTVFSIILAPVPAAAADGTGAAADNSLQFWAVNEGGARIYRPDAAACSRIGGLSAQYADALSSKYHVPAYQLKILEVRPPEGAAGCLLVVDMPAGPRECQIGSVMRTFGGSFLAHTYAQDADGSVRYVAGACR
jgi:hypothetical protein